jgi:hypothetical protein
LTDLEALLAEYNLTPGSTGAKAKGCTCVEQDTATETYSVDNDCPIHGMAALAAIVGNGPKEDDE